MSNSRRDGENKNLATFLALAALLFLSAGLLGLATIVMPGLAAVLLVVFGFVFVGCLHYVVWGWWLTGRKPDDDDQQ